MNTPSQAKPACITSLDIESVAREGVERALAARQAMAELSPEEAQAVGGGALSLKLAYPIIAGGIRVPVDSMNIGGLAAPALY
jgi:hypothetical protein